MLQSSIAKRKQAIQTRDPIFKLPKLKMGDNWVHDPHDEGLFGTFSGIETGAAGAHFSCDDDVHELLSLTSPDDETSHRIRILISHQKRMRLGILTVMAVPYLMGLLQVKRRTTTTC